MGIPTLIGLVVVVGTVIINIIALATPDWIADTDSYTGLWIDCDYASGPSPCQTIGSDAPAFIKATRGMELLGLLILITSGSIVLLRIVCMKDKQSLSVLGGVGCIVAGCFMILGGIIFAGTFSSDGGSKADLSTGFALAIVAGISSIVPGIIFILGRHQ